MLKNKEDNFLGDGITHNIKYADNEWQAHGTVDRNSVYTKESLLHLLFEEKEYDRDTGNYKYYVPRGSTANIFGKNYMGAKLQHDITLLDTVFYSTSPISSSINIFDIDTYLKKAIAVANPVFDDKAAVKVIPMVDVESLKKNGSTVTLNQFFSALNPETYESGTSDTSRNKFLLERYGIASKDADKTLIEIFDGIMSESKKKIFHRDFQLRMHEESSIKLPFNKRAANTSENLNDTKTYETRFISNSFCGRLLNNDMLSQKRIEYLNDVIEEAIFSNDFIDEFNLVSSSSERFDDEDQNFTSITNTKNPATGDKYHVSEWLREKGYGSILDKYVSNDLEAEDSADKTSIVSLVEGLFKYKSNINNYCTDVYTGYNENVSFPTSYGIHLLSEEDTTNMFQDEEKSYRLFNEVVLGYGLVNCLLSARTFLGGTALLFNGDNFIKENTEISYTENIPLSLVPKFNYVKGNGNVNYYETVTMLNNAYKLGHGLDISDSLETSSAREYVLADEIKEWLENECFVFKTPVYGDYVEELNFMQDLNPDSDVQFRNVRVKKTEIPYKRFQDSKYEVPYVEQTSPLLNNTPENEKIPSAHASDALAGVGNIVGKDNNKNVFPPFIYDYDKGDEEDKIASSDKRTMGYFGKQRVNYSKGNLTIEERINSPTIDELWAFLKYLTESDGKTKEAKDLNVNERLPSFFGIKKSSIMGSLFTTENSEDESGIKNTVNPLASEDNNIQQVDILNWAPDTKKLPVHYNSKEHPELQFGGFTVTRYIEKIYDYKVNIFGRRTKDTENEEHKKIFEGESLDSWDGTKYEFNTENLDDYNNTSGYLEKLFNSAILGFAIENMDPLNEDRNWNLVEPRVLKTDALDDSADASRLFTTTNDQKFLTKNKPVEASDERKKAFDAISRILTWHGATDGETESENGYDTSYHNHFKKYLEQPKNLKEIERDLETIRQNLQAFVEFYVAQSASKGFNDRSFNRGTIHELHRNHFSYDSTLLRLRPGTLDPDGVAINLNSVEPEENEVLVKLEALSNTLNNLVDSLNVATMDQKVVFEDGQFDERYQRQNYDRHLINLSGSVENERHPHEMYRANETLLSEVYLAADGTWRSIHEHGVVPIVYDDM